MTTHDSIPDRQRTFEVSVTPPRSVDAQYYDSKQISLYVTNISNAPQLIEMLTIQFQTDTGASPAYLDHNCGIQIEQNKAAEINITVRPTPIYRENTNSFGVMVRYRTLRGSRLQTSQLEELHSTCSFLIIRPPPITLGGVFISFKQLENLAYAEILERYARRAGFQPYLVKTDPRPGTDQWQRIESAIKQSLAAFVIWTSLTKFGTGVEKEIELCRKYNVKEILLIEKEHELPALYRDTKLEYVTFDPSNPSPEFCEAVNALRDATFQKNS